MDLAEAMRQVLRASHRTRPEDLPDLVMRVAPLLDASAVLLYLVDHQQRWLVPLTGTLSPARQPVPISGTVAGRTFGTLADHEVPGADGVSLWIPLLDGAERLGVLEVVGTGSYDEARHEDLRIFATLMAELTVTRGLYGDTLELLRRRAPMQLPAELLRAQLPPLTFATERLVISGLLEPCYQVGGDAFDYSVTGDLAHLALFDAVGHGSQGGLRAAVLASIALAAYRNARRGALPLVETYHHIDRAVRAHDRAGMITAVLAELDQGTGRLRVISAGHPSGLVLRGGRLVRILPTPTALPMTLGDLQPPQVAEEDLQPGDDVLLYTDGIVEARSADGEPFGVDRLVDFAVRALADGLPAPETTRRLVHAILDYQNDELTDDATLLMARWLG
ncbi:Serine phosphatase RsbU, regulator of sigma subunit [Micromonospora echinospora]|uniref:Serine phosphatase RsbU, regulator of sigma subunit n=1 Tax=Micromonospora echinospora TaxID=1877 RepID=A0A1C4UPN1_MICEC|nr:PP2C family protein-serine/threonine phosphatase [Micromonospora echinospora]SCE73617.1 Serine phosphatase RsbU, regulator of sigma subunit [Micromonospora echinospora]